MPLRGHPQNSLNNLPAPSARVTNMNISGASPSRSQTGHYVINLPHQKEPLFTEYRNAHSHPNPSQHHVSNTTSSILTDPHRKMQTAVDSSTGPEHSYKVPNNTPAKALHPGQTSPRYVVQLPATYLQKRSMVHHKLEENDTGSSESATIPAPKFAMPPPSLFKAAPKSAPLRIRPPPGQEEGSSSSDNKAEEQFPSLSVVVPQMQTPELAEDEKHDAVSPTTTLGTSTPATLNGPFTPLMGSGMGAEFSPDATGHKSLVVEHGLGPDATKAKENGPVMIRNVIDEEEDHSAPTHHVHVGGDTSH